MSEFRKRLFNKLLADAGSGAETLVDVLDRPGRATRAAIDAYQQDKPILGAIGSQLTEKNPEAPPTGAELAETFQEQSGVDNPYVLGALATMADTLDPTMLIPGGAPAKLGLKGVKGMRMADKAADAAKGLPARGVGKGITLKDNVPVSAGQKASKELEESVGKKPFAANRHADYLRELLGRNKK